MTLKTYCSLLIMCSGTYFFLYSTVPADQKGIIKSLEGKEPIADAAIIGSGPAGLAASIPLARAGYRTIVFQGPKPGGELMDSAIVENWPGLPKESGAESMNKLEKQAVSFGAFLDPHTVVDIDFSVWPFKLTTNNETTIYALTVIIATGASQKKLGIENEDIYWGHGLFSCGLCDASFTQGKDAIVIGGGDIAIQRALQIAPQAKSVTLIVSGPGLTATESMQKKIKDLNNVTVLPEKQVLKIIGDGTNITHAELYDINTKQMSLFETHCVFLSTGLTANTELFKDKLELDQYGCIKLKEGRTQETAIQGVMAAGTVADPRYRQVAVVVGDSTKAAIDALKFLSSCGFDGPLKDSLTDRLYKPMPLTHIKHIRSMHEFWNTIHHEKGPVLVEFYSPLCSHCKKMEAPVAALAEKFSHVLKVFKVNKDKLSKLIGMNGIKVVPAFIVFDQGHPIGDRLEGETTQERLFEFAEEACHLATTKKRSLCNHDDIIEEAPDSTNSNN